MSKRIILASSSPRRRQLLLQIGLQFDTIPANIHEAVDPKSSPVKTVETLALKKAGHIAIHHKDALVIGSDTIVVRKGEIIGKPSDAEEARAMLRSLSGITHQVYTGVAIVVTENGNDSIKIKIRHTFHECTNVRFGVLADEEIAAYVRTGSPFDKAGAYGIQDDLGALFVEKIEGDYYNVVGFPLYRFYREVNKLVPGTVTPFDVSSV